MLTIAEAGAVNVVLRCAAGTVDDEDDFDDFAALRGAVATLVEAAYKKLGAGLCPQDVEGVASAIFYDERVATDPPVEPPADDDVDAVAVPVGRLPEFEGVIPVGVVTRVTGAGGRITRPMHLGERVITVVESIIEDVAHRSTDEGVKRHQKLGIEDLFELPGPAGRRLLNTLRERYAQAAGVDVLPFGQAVDDYLSTPATSNGRTDASGVVVTPGDATALGLDDPEAPVLVVYARGTRAIWPEDFAPGITRPAPGDVYLIPGAPIGAAPGLVTELRDPVSDALLAAWTEDDARAEAEAEAEAAPA